jgi:hypothetical protein
MVLGPVGHRRGEAPVLILHYDHIAAAFAANAQNLLSDLLIRD